MGIGEAERPPFRKEIFEQTIFHGFVHVIVLEPVTLLILLANGHGELDCFPSAPSPPPRKKVEVIGPQGSDYAGSK